ncbi:BamA/TamA family outer membrane protein [Rhodocytophaga aerolata]|uniref:BamA/TamA family outer membrane protein n=1 Tax=Rhodocytophaga aerolata TaxID=455078 RepID=A0ABT8RBE4_9BACT|nr:BamA/TamA family outer membrane protein [Rhodocytophaga aerolata]MDO1448077.1 BamA/TamA family outer membrane protein [Rhodocytophaga aerolata]
MTNFLGTLTLLCCLISTSGQAQVFRWAKERVIRFLADSTEPGQPQFIAYPTLAYSPETGLEIGVSSLYLYYARKDTTNRLSEVAAFTFITLERQYGLWLDHALYTHQNKWFVLGRLRFQRFPLLYYGIGPQTPSQYQAVVDANAILLRERFLRKVKGSFYAGLEVDYQQLTNVSFERNPEFVDQPNPVGSEGSRNLGIGLGLVYDNRHNVLNVRHGFFAETGFLRYTRALGSNYTFTNFFFDTRYFHPIARKQVLATQVFALFNNGNVPFNQLALLGGESVMRGYYLGRYRDKNLIASQVEYRWLPFPFSKRFGGTLFVGAGNVAPGLGEFRFQSVKVSGGGGLRFLLFPKKDVFTRLDFAFSKESNGFYIFIGEAF